MPKTSIKCEHCGETAFYQRTTQRDIESKRGKDEHVGALPVVKMGDHHVYRCPKCEHLTKVAVD